MNSISVLVFFLLVISGYDCNANNIKENEVPRTTKSFDIKRVEKKSTNEKKESAELANGYGFGQKEEPSRPIYQFHFPGLKLDKTASSPQLAYNKPDAAITVNSDSTQGHISKGNNNNGVNGAVHYLSLDSFKGERDIPYISNSYKLPSGGAPQYTPFAYSETQQAPIIHARSHAGQFYTTVPVHHQSPQLGLRQNYGGIPQPLQQQHVHQQQFVIAIPVEYVQGYQHNQAPHSTEMVQLVYKGQPQISSAPDHKDQQYREDTMQHLYLASNIATPHGSHPVAEPAVITHNIPFYRSDGQQTRQAQPPSPTMYYYGSYDLQANTPSHHQQQTQKQIYEPIQTAAMGTDETITSIPFKKVYPAVHQQQLQHQALKQHYQNHHPVPTSYMSYPESSSDSKGSNSAKEIPIYTADGSALVQKQGALYSSANRENFLRSLVQSNTNMSHLYGANSIYEGPLYTHLGAIHYRTHLYNPHRNVIYIASNKVTAGSATIAGVSPPPYYEQFSTKSSHRGRGSSNSAM